MNEAIRPARNVELGASNEPFQNLHEFVRKARANLNQNAWDYIVGAAETETTMRRNRMALDEIAFRPRVLRDVAKVDASVERFGRKMRLPVMLAPVGALEIFDPAGAAARGARRRQLRRRPHAELGVRARAGEDRRGRPRRAAHLPALCPRRRRLCRGLSSAARSQANYTAFCLTVDTAHYSRRERDIAKRYVRESRAARHRRRLSRRGWSWRTVKLIKDKYKIPLILKGIATAEDAKIALDHGVEWIYVSNHGGRQLDHGRGSMHVLPEIVDAVKGRAKIMVDGGFCRGTDIVKAIAMGADLVGIGRLQCWALAAAGETGVLRMLELLEDEVVRSPRPARRHLVRRAEQILSASGNGDQHARACSAPSRCSTSSPIGTETIGRASGVSSCHADRMMISAHDPALASLPADADALLFDLGRVVLDIDFSKALACWAGHAGCEPARHRRALRAPTNLPSSRDAARSATRNFSTLALARSASPSPTSSFSKAGTRSLPARWTASCHCWHAPASICRSMPSPTPTARMSHISPKEYADVLEPFPRDISFLEHRPAKAGCRGVRPRRPGDGRAGLAHRVLR